MMSRKSRFTSAFTVVEMTIVLAISAFLLLASPMADAFESTEPVFRWFIQDFLSQLEGAQSYAVITGKAVKLELFKPIGSVPYVRFSAQDTHDPFINRKLALPHSVSLREPKTFWIKADTGYIKPDTIVFSSPRETVSIKIQMGNGRYHVERQRK